MNRIATSAAFAVLIVTFPAPTIAGTILVPGDQPTIQAAIDAAADGDEVVVLPGTYNELINFNGKAITLRSLDGPQVTIIDGTGLDDSIVRCVSGERPSTLLDGFTITGGTGGSRGAFFSIGGGMLNGENASPTILNCVFVGNIVEESGGGMWNSEGSSPTVANCTFISNHAAHSGGGMMNAYSSSPLIQNCRFENNTASDYGGAINNNALGNASLVNCSLVGNVAGAGGGLANIDNSPLMVNCTFAANIAVGGGCCGCGGACADVARGGGLFDRAESTPTITNCIFWSNLDEGGIDESAQLHVTNGTPTINHSLIQGWTGALGGVGNIDDDPLFVDLINGDLHISLNSPAIDVGDNSVVEPGAVDIDGQPRILNDIVDMGADEFNPCPADLTLDGFVNAADLALLLGSWGSCPAPPADCPADIAGTGDGLVNAGDLAVLLGNWGMCY